MLNSVTLIGNLGKDPESRFMPNGEQVVSFSLATSRSWKNKQSGQRETESEWHRITIFGKLGEIAVKYLKKGSKVYLQGRLKTQKYQKNGVDTYATSIIADEMIMLDGKHEDSEQQQRPAQPQQRTKATKPTTSNYDDYDDPDIPF